MSAMLDLPDPPTAVFAGNNLVTVGVLAALRRRDLLHTIAVVGFDDLDLATVVDPPLTVIDQEPEAIGRIAARGDLRLARRSGSDQGCGGAGAPDRSGAPARSPGRSPTVDPTSASIGYSISVTPASRICATAASVSPGFSSTNLVSASGTVTR